MAFLLLRGSGSGGGGGGGGGGATPFFTEDFKTGYTWGTRPVTSQATVSAQIGTNWQYVDFASGHGAIDDWPTDSNRRAFRQQYVNSDDLDVMQHKFDPTHVDGAGRPTTLYVQWKEYRSSTFDFGPSKDFRFGIYRAAEYGGGSGHVICDVYGGFVNPTAAGTSSDCTTVTLNVQGGGAYSQPGDPNVIGSAAYVMPKATEVTIEVYIKLNTPSNTDGEMQIWVDGVSVLSDSTVRFYSWTEQAYVDFFQMGMSATNGGVAFSGTSNRWMTGVKMATGYIGV